MSVHVCASPISPINAQYSNFKHSHIGATIHTKNGLIVSAKKRTNFFYETVPKEDCFKIASAPSSLESIFTPLTRQYHMASPVLSDIKFNTSMGITSADVKESKCPFNRN